MANGRANDLVEVLIVLTMKAQKRALGNQERAFLF
jgi:hypothetical protein